MVLVPLKKILTLYFSRLCLYHSMTPLMHGMIPPSSFYKLSHGWVWLFVGFLLGFALLKEFCWVMVVLYDFVKVIHFLCKEFRCRTYLFSSVDEGVDNR